MNKQSKVLLKQAAYYIKRAEMEKQSANIGKAVGKGIESAEKGAKAVANVLGAGYNLLRGSKKNKVKEIPTQEPAPEINNWRTPVSEKAMLYDNPKRISDDTLSSDHRIVVPDYMQGWSPNEFKYYKALVDYEMLPQLTHDRLTSLPVNSMHFASYVPDVYRPLMPEKLSNYYEDLPKTSFMRIPGITRQDISQAVWQAMPSVRRSILDSLLTVKCKRKVDS